MKIRHTLMPLTLLILMSLGALTSLAQEPADPIIRLDSETKLELDLGMMMDDLLPRLMALLEEEDPEQAQTVQFALDLIGLEALQNLKLESKESKDHSKTKVRLTLDKEHSDSLLFQLYTTPNGPCRFARYLDRDELAMFASIQNFAHFMDVIFEFLKRDDIAALLGDMPVNEQGDLDLDGFVPRTDLLPLLSGELDIVLFTVAEGEELNPMSMPMSLVLGSTDGFALRNMIVGLMEATNPEAGGISSMLAEIEPEMVGDFEMQVTPFGLVIATSEDFLVLGMQPERMRPMLAGEHSGMKVPDGIEYAMIDGENYGDLMGGLMAMSAMMGGDQGETEWMMEFYDGFFNYLETEEVLYRSRGDNVFEAEIETRGSVITGLYQMLPTFIDRLPEIMAEAENEFGGDDPTDGYQDAIGMMDQAMMSYAADHDGAYPEDPTTLYQEGYLEEWPFLNESPAGTYSDWSYSYHTYRDDNGVVNGYIFFLYGGDPTGGYDVYTPENIIAEGPFAIAEDGIPDGVVSFCFDGVALKMVEEYFDR